MNEFMDSGAPRPEDLEKINRYTRRSFTAQELYTFGVVLCDNEVDRDFERFTGGALKRLAALYPGRTGILDHKPRAANQCARIYSCWVETPPGRTTQAGEPYQRLCARAYLPRGPQNEALILELESGIKKEVSVGCSVASASCSICGADPRAGGCAHIRGKRYQGRLCHTVLDCPTDAYEWSFVAVPAQREAGVIKSKEGKGTAKMERIKNLLKSGEETVLTAEQTARLAEELQRLEQEAAAGRAYREDLTKDVRRLCGLAQPSLPLPVLDRMLDSMDIGDIKELKKAFRAGAEQAFPLSPQLAPESSRKITSADSAFQI